MAENIEMRGDNPLQAVVKGTEANAHLVATNGLAFGVAHAVEQYNIPTDKVLAAIKFYLDNRDEIDKLYQSVFDNAPTHDEQLDRIKRKKEAYLQQLKKSS